MIEHNNAYEALYIHPLFIEYIRTWSA